MKRTYKVALVLLALVLGGITSLAGATPYAETPHNLVRQDAKFFDEVYVQDNANFADFTKVYIESATLELDDRWKRDFRNNIAPNYIPYVFNTFPKLMEKQLKQAFGKSEKYQLVDTREQADLILIPKISDFYINGPEFTTLTNTFVNHVGRGTLEITVKDKAGDTLAKLVDNRETRNFGAIGQLRLANRARNYRDFRFLMQRWSDETVRYLN